MWLVRLVLLVQVAPAQAESAAASASAAAQVAASHATGANASAAQDVPQQERASLGLQCALNGASAQAGRAASAQAGSFGVQLGTQS